VRRKHSKENKEIQADLENTRPAQSSCCAKRIIQQLNCVSNIGRIPKGGKDEH
jgi:hypothetical protein